MMIPRRREAKQEGDPKFSFIPPSTSSSSRKWSAFRNPRIVRVSRSFGGKDRHSKVSTIKGLRDRRIRLSVPTAIELYDLQDRLGLSQPSKVIDWLLDATKDDIDKLPPLQIPEGFGHQFGRHPILPQSSLAHPFFLDPNLNPTFMNKDVGFQSLGIKINSTSSTGLESKSKQAETSSEKGKWVKSSDQEENQDGVCNFFPLLSTNTSSLPVGLLNNNNIPMPLNSYYQHWDSSSSSNLSLSQFGTHQGFLSQHQTENSLNYQTSITAAAPFPSGSHLFFCPPTTTPSIFPPYPPYLTTNPGLANPQSYRETHHAEDNTHS